MSKCIAIQLRARFLCALANFPRHQRWWSKCEVMNQILVDFLTTNSEHQKSTSKFIIHHVQLYPQHHPEFYVPATLLKLMVGCSRKGNLWHFLSKGKFMHKQLNHWLMTKLQNVLLVWSVYTYRHQKQTNQHFESSNSHTNDYFMHTLHRVHSLIKLFLSLPAADWLFFLLQGFNNFRHQVWKEWKSNCQSPGLLPVWKSARKLSSKASHLSTIVEKFVQYYMST